MKPREGVMTLLVPLSCPKCRGQLQVRYNRPRRKIARWGYQAVCDGCGWRKNLQEAWCENCDQMNHAMRVADGWICLRCGQVIE